MNTPIRILRPLLAACCLLASLLPLRAQTWQNFDLMIPAGRLSHGFSLSWEGSAPISLGGLEVNVTMENSLTGRFQLQLDVETSAPVSLHDDTAGQTYLLGSLGGGAGTTTISVGADGWQGGSGAPMQYFSLPDERSGHTMILYQPASAGQVATFYPVTVNWWQYTNGAATTQAIYGAATYDPSRPYWLVDLSATPPVRSTTNDVDLARDVWTIDYDHAPVAQVTIYLDGTELGHQFTLHKRAPGGSVQCTNVLATTSPASYDYDSDWNYFQAEGAAVLQGSIPQGFEFWITRSADQAQWPAQPVTLQTADSSVSPPNWRAFGCFAPLPPPPAPSATQSFRVRDWRNGHNFTVNQFYPASDQWISQPIGNWNQGTLYSYDDQGNSDSTNYCGFLSFDAQIDPSRPFILRDENVPEAFPEGVSEVLEGWTPWHPEPPSNTSLTINVFARRDFSPLHLTWPSAVNGFNYSIDVGPDANPTYASKEYRDGAGNLLYSLDYISFSVTNPLPYYTGEITIQHRDHPEYGVFTVSSAAPIDLTGWLPDPYDIWLNISSSRWGHDLRLVQPNGFSAPLRQYATAGDYSFDASGQGWFNSWHYFYATVPYYYFLDWWIEDRDTGETSPSYWWMAADWGLRAGTLINWIALADPKNLTATEQPDGTFQLTWTFAETSTEGAFKLERRESDSEPWDLLATIPAAGNLNTTTGTASAPATLAASQPGKTAGIRVSYEYGGRRSAPSNTVSLANMDSDGDEIPDWWETANGLSPTDPSDAAAPASPGGPSNKDKYKNGPDPTTTDTDKDGVNDAYDLYPDDDRRTKDVPMIRYAALDFAPAIFGPLHYGWFAAIDDTNKVSILAAEHNSVGTLINYKVATWTLGEPLPVAGTFRTVPAAEVRGSYTANYYPAAINATGTVVGTAYIGQSSGYENTTPPPLPAGYPGCSQFAFTWTGAGPSIEDEHYRKYEGVTSSGLAWGSDPNGKFIFGPIKFGKYVSDSGSSGQYRFHYDPDLFTFWGTAELSPPNCLITADGRAYGIRNYRSNPGDLSSGYDLHSGALWTGSEFKFLFGEDDYDTMILALGEGDRAFGYSSRFVPPSTPLFSGSKAVPGTHPFMRVGETMTAFQSSIPTAFQRQVGFSPITSWSVAPAKWAVINPQGDIMARAQFLEGKNKLDAKWVDGALLWNASHPDKFYRADLANPPAMMNKDHILVSGATILLPMEIMIVDRDDPTKKWTDAQDGKGMNIYAGESTGDMVSWKLSGTGSWPSTNIEWSAEGPDGQTIQGPSGAGKSEWKIADDDEDAANDWLKWIPGKWKIKVKVASSAAEFEQQIGWRTEDYAVIGQIVQTSAHDGDKPGTSGSAYQFRRAIVYDIDAWFDDDLEREAAALLPLPPEIFTGVWVANWGLLESHGSTPKGPFTSGTMVVPILGSVSVGTVNSGHRYWMVQTGLNMAPDDPKVDEKIAASDLQTIRQEREFRIMHRYQAKFFVGEDGKVSGDHYPLIVGDHIADKGVTKGGFALTADQLYPGSPVIGPFTFPFMASEDNEFNHRPTSTARNNEPVSADRTKISGYSTARIGEIGRNVNWRLFGKDAPWIFSEIVHEVLSDRSIQTTHRTSVDISWQDGSVIEGETPFNNLNIYKRQKNLETEDFDYVRQGDILSMEGKLKPFIDSASGKWPEPNIPPSVK